MNPCPKCDRNHSGVCGIPAGVTRGFGARVGGVGIGGAGPRAAPGERTHPKAAKPNTRILEGMLSQAEGHLGKVMEMLKVLPAEMPEFADLLDRETKLSHLIQQVIGQISAARGAK